MPASTKGGFADQSCNWWARRSNDCAVMQAVRLPAGGSVDRARPPLFTSLRSALMPLSSPGYRSERIRRPDLESGDDGDPGAGYPQDGQ